MKFSNHDMNPEVDEMDPPPLHIPLEHRRRRWTLPMCIFSIAMVECCFYFVVLGIFTIGMKLFQGTPKLHNDDSINEVFRSMIIGFGGVYFLLSFVLVLGALRKNRILLMIWIGAVVLFMILEWMCVVISVAIFLNGSLFFISGSYGPLRLYFVCLTALYVQRLKYIKQNNMEAAPVVKASKHSDGYSVVHNAIFAQDLDDSQEEEGPVKVTFAIGGSGSDQSLI